MQELEKILEEIDREKKNVALSTKHTTAYVLAQIRMAERIEEIIRKHMNDGWISVDERLPENDDFVLVTVTGIYNALTFSDAIQLASYCKGDGWFVEGYPDWENPNISAWRPLPEPYCPERSRE